MEKENLSWDDVNARALVVAQMLQNSDRRNEGEADQHIFSLYGIPRGGIFAALLVSGALCELGIHNVIEEEPQDANVYIDDVIDTGATLHHYNTTYGIRPFFALVDKRERGIYFKGKWITFPWERATSDEGPVENVRRLIEYIGDDPEREGLIETPKRVIESYKKLFGGYGQKPKDIIKVFENDNYDEMIVVKNIEFYSTCEHHMLPFYGKAHIAYIPAQKIIGISKLARILEIYARRLQIQERLCQQVTEAIDNLIRPFGSACILEAQHFCMTARGIEKQSSIVTTSSLTGSFKNSTETRDELINIIRK